MKKLIILTIISATLTGCEQDTFSQSQEILQKYPNAKIHFYKPNWGAHFFIIKTIDGSVHEIVFSDDGDWSRDTEICK